MRFRLLLALLACAKLCEKLGYDVHLPAPGGRCFCGDEVNPKDPNVLSPFTLRLIAPKQAPKELYDDRVHRDYDPDL